MSILSFQLKYEMKSFSSICSMYIYQMNFSDFYFFNVTGDYWYLKDIIKGCNMFFVIYELLNEVEHDYVVS
jgi:hypothetical protein